MHFRLDAPFKTVDPVVAMRPSRRDADASFDAPQRAGFGRGMPAVVGHRGPTVDADSLGTAPRAGQLSPAASDSCRGLAWAAFIAPVLLPPPAGDAAFAAPGGPGAPALLPQTSVVGRLIAPKRDGHAAQATARQVANRDRSPSWHVQGEGRGTRSDIALARPVLANH